MRTGIYLLIQKCYDNYCCHGGKAIEHYFLADLTIAQALHSSHQSVCVCVCVCICVCVCVCVCVYIYIYIQGVPGGMCQSSGECSLC